MFSVEKCQVPADTMLEKYLMNGAYADCYKTEIAQQVSFSDFIFAFYTTPLFKTERLILKFTVSKPSTDNEAKQLANGEAETFAAWTIEGRSDNELLICDFIQRTRSWFMIVPVNENQTRLYFGSVVSSHKNPKTGKLSLGFIFHALLGFHQMYSILLLASAKRRLKHYKNR